MKSGERNKSHDITGDVLHLPAVQNKREWSCTSAHVDSYTTFGKYCTGMVDRGIKDVFPETIFSCP